MSPHFEAVLSLLEYRWLFLLSKPGSVPTQCKYMRYLEFVMLLKRLSYVTVSSYYIIIDAQALYTAAHLSTQYGV
jgi:hypothetical protein